MKPLIRQLDEICEDEDRDPESVVRTFDLYTVIPEGFGDSERDDLGMDQPVAGSSDEIAAYLLGFAELGFEDVRVDVWPRSTEAIKAMQPVVEMVQRG